MLLHGLRTFARSRSRAWLRYCRLGEAFRSPYTIPKSKSASGSDRRSR